MSELFDALKIAAAKRRSQYDLGREMPVSRGALQEMFEHILLTSPSPRNSQTARLVLVMDNRHEQMWHMVEKLVLTGLREDLVPGTLEKFSGFRQAAGTLLFFEDEGVLRDIVARYPRTAEDTMLFSAHANAMHQYAAWTQLAALHIGANLQHYYSAAAAIRDMLGLPDEWRMHAQLVFGSIQESTRKVKEQHLPIGERMLVFADSRF